MSLQVPSPAPPDWAIDWSAVIDRYPILETLKEVPQDPTHHGEGDVFVHTKFVGEALVGSARWQTLAPEDREELFLAALLHDIGKAGSTKRDLDGRLTSPGHSRRGARQARRLLWEAGAPFAARERVVNLIRYHQVPYWILDRATPERLARQISLSVRCDHLALLATADARGRKTKEGNSLTDNIALFEELAGSLDCLDRPARFASDHGRFLYFRERWSLPELAPFEAFCCHVIVLSGLPGAGKDHYLAHHHRELPTVSLDAIRSELDVDPQKNQGTVIQEARERARQYLRQGKSFVWNATNVSRPMRRQLINLLTGYKAKVELVYIESDRERLFEQNNSRSPVVPTNVIDDLIDHRWDVPDPWEAHIVRYL